MAFSTDRHVSPIPLTLVTALLLVVSCAMRSAHATPLGHLTTDSEVLLQDPRIVRRVSAWGLSIHDIRHDVSAMSPAERVQLAYVVSRQWQGTKSQPQAAQQTQFLVLINDAIDARISAVRQRYLDRRFEVHTVSLNRVPWRQRCRTCCSARLLPQQAIATIVELGTRPGMWTTTRLHCQQSIDRKPRESATMNVRIEYCGM